MVHRTGPDGQRGAGVGGERLDENPDIGDDIARRLVAEKIAAQAEVLAIVDRVAQVGDEMIDAVRIATATLHVATCRAEVRQAEARAAAACWQASPAASRPG